jgi:hypothetical protein
LGATAFVAVALVDTGLRTNHPGGAGSLTSGPLGVLVPPYELPYDATANLISMVWAGSSIVSAIFLSVRDYRRSGVTLPLFLVLSAPVGAFAGIIVDVIGGAYMADGPHLPTFIILGRNMGAFIFAAWSGFAIFMYAVFTMLSSGLSTRLLWWLLAGACVVEIGSEEALLARGAYAYFGNQPLVLLNHLPWWFVPCNMIGCFLAAALAFRYRNALTGWRGAFMLAIAPVSVLLSYATIGVPSFIAVNGTYPWLYTQMLGLATMAMSVGAAAIILALVLHRRPFAGSATPDKAAVSTGQCGIADAQQ